MNHDWRSVKSETKKVNDLWTNTPTSNLTELNDLIYAGAKVVCEKIGRKSKPKWELRLEPQIKKPRQAKILKPNMKQREKNDN